MGLPLALTVACTSSPPAPGGEDTAGEAPPVDLLAGEYSPSEEGLGMCAYRIRHFLDDEFEQPEAWIFDLEHNFSTLEGDAELTPTSCVASAATAGLDGYLWRIRTSDYSTYQSGTIDTAGMCPSEDVQTLASYAPRTWYVDGPRAIEIAREEAWQGAALSFQGMQLFSAGYIDADCSRLTFEDGDPSRGLDIDHPVVIVRATVDMETRGAAAIDGRTGDVLGVGEYY